MTQPQFAELLNVSPDTYRRWESVGASAVAIPAPVAAHVRTIQSLKKIYAHWDKIARIIPIAGHELLLNGSVTGAVEMLNKADELSAGHEKLWGKLFPMLDRDGDEK